MMEAGVAKAIITPWRGLPLAGYFNPRPNTGVLDDLHVRCVLFRAGRTLCGLVALDVCMLSAELVQTILARLRAAGFRHGSKLIFSATHSHTAPYVTPLFGTAPDPDYLSRLAEKTVESVLTAQQNLAPSTLRLGGAKDNPLAFNRRYWMQDGRVLTNPGKGNPHIVKPEGPVDRELGLLSIEQGGRIIAVVANIVNHTDTLGGSLVSADWPGRLERGVQAILGYEPTVMTLIGCSGNVNHFDVSSRADQTSYAEACRIGQAYASRAATLLRRLKPLDAEKLTVINRQVTIPYRTLSEEACRAARAVLGRASGAATYGDMTSEGLASGDGPVARFFAEQTLRYRATCSGKKRAFSMVALAFGERFAIASLPGEPFTEIGLAIKRGSPFKTTWPVALAMGACGYVPLAACFARGGYETLPVEGGAPCEHAADLLIRGSLRNLGAAHRG